MLRKFRDSKDGSVAIEYGITAALIVSGLMALLEPLSRQAAVFDSIAIEMQIAVGGDAAAAR